MSDSSKWQFCKTCDEYHEFGDDEHGVRQHLVTCRPGSPPTDDGTPAPPSNLTPGQRECVEILNRQIVMEADGPAVCRASRTALRVVIDAVGTLDAKLAEVTRERDGAIRTSRELRQHLEGRIDILKSQLAAATEAWGDTVPDYYSEAVKRWPWLRVDETLDDNWRNRKRAENAAWLLRQFEKKLYTATEAKKRAEKSRDGYKLTAMDKERSLAKMAPWYWAVRDIAKTLGLPTNTDPQEVVKAVGRMRELLWRCRNDIFQTARSNHCNLTGIDLNSPEDGPVTERIGNCHVHQSGINESLALVRDIETALANQRKEANDG